MSKEIKNKFLQTVNGEFVRMDMITSITYNDFDKCYRGTVIEGGTVRLTAEEVKLVIAVGGHMERPLAIEE